MTKAVLQRALAACLAILAGSGCLLVRTTEHRIQLNPDGTGEAVLRLVDIRSDADSDSGQAADLGAILATYRDQGLRVFEARGRSVTSKRLYLRGDTLCADIAYRFATPEAVEGLRVVDDQLTMVIPADRFVERTNGSIATDDEGRTVLRWDREARRLSAVITERSLPWSVSLGPRYRALR